MADYNFNLNGAINPAQVWSETQQKWVNPGPNSGAMPSPLSNTGLMNIGTNSNPFGAQWNAQDPWSNAAYRTALGNQAGAQYATAANRVNQVTPYGSLNYSQSTDQYGNPTWTATQSLSPELQALSQSSLAGLQASQANPMYGINPGQTYSDAIMQRLAPQQKQAKESFDVQMANQGIPVGSEAYNRAYRNFSQGQNDQLTSAIVGGMNTGLQAQQLQNQTAANIRSLSAPSYVNPYTQAAVTGPDYLGAAGLSNQNAIANQNMQNAASANLQSGLFNLAGTGLMAYALS